jgi:hypothetical protein
MKTIRTLLLAAAMGIPLFGTAVSATAAVIYDNGSPGGGFAQTSDRDFIDGIEAADDFSLTAGHTTIQDIHWWGTYIGSNTPQAVDSFTINIFDDASGKPGSLVATPTITNLTRTDTGTDFGSSDIFLYSAIVSDTPLAAGTTYWLSIVNDTTVDTDDNWAWVGTVGDLHSAIRVAPNTTWENSNTNDLAFNLTGDVTTDGPVPEPSTLLLLAGGLVGVTAWRRRS